MAPLPTTFPGTPNSTTANSTPSGVSTSSIDGVFDVNKSPDTQPSGSVQTVSPTVVTSKPAQSDYANIQSNYDGIVSGMQTQATNVATQNAQKEAQNKLDAEAKAKQTNEATTANAALTAANAKANAVAGTPVQDPYLGLAGTTGYNPITGKSDSITDISKQSDGSYRVSFASDPNQKVVSAQDMAKFGWSKEQIAQDQLETSNANFQKEATNVQNTLMGIQNGAIPLNEGQLAQIEGLKQQFGQLIQQQNLANSNASGVANIRGYQTGAAEYDPSFQVKTIGSIITAGQNKIADLNIKMAAAVADMTEAFKTKNANAVKDAWNIYQEAAKTRQNILKTTVENAQKQIKEAQDAKIKADKVVYDEVTKPIMDMSSLLAKTPGVPPEVVANVSNAKTVGEAIQAAGEYLQSGTGSIGEYLLYKRQVERNGGKAESYDIWTQRKAQEKANIAFKEAMAKKGVAVGKGGVVGKGNAQVPDFSAKKQFLVNTIDTALGQIDKYTTGTVYGQVAGMIPGTEAKDLQKNIDTIKANIGFEELQAMKAASKTGASGLGSLAVAELNALQSTLGNLDRSQSATQLKANLQAIKDHYTKAVNLIEQSQTGGAGTEAVLKANNIQPSVFQNIKADYPNMSDQEILNEMRSQRIIK